MKTIQKTAIKQAVLTALYVTCVASFMYFGGQAKLGRANIILVRITMLLIFVFSASLTGYLLFGKPILMYLNGKKKEAMSLFIYTISVFSLITLVFIVLLILYTR